MGLATRGVPRYALVEGVADQPFHNRQAGMKYLNGYLLGFIVAVVVMKMMGH